jgi:predicted nucleic acid-binding protein
MDKILIDSDVILDSIFDRKPFSDDSAQILALCERGEIKGFITPIIISNIYYLLRKINTHERNIEILKMLLSIVDIAIITKETILKALDSNFKDFEDALQNYAVQDQTEISIIITRNVKDYKGSKLAVMSPDSYLRVFNL